MNKSELKSLIREEIKMILKEVTTTKYVFSGNKNFMSRVAVPIFKKYGIETAKLKSYDPDSDTTEITVTIDNKIADKIGNEIEKHPRAQDEYGGYFEAKRAGRRESKMMQERRIPFKGKTTNDLYKIVKADANAMVFANGNHYSVDAENMRNDLRNPSIIVTDEDGEEFEIKVSDIEFIELNERVIKEASEKTFKAFGGVHSDKQLDDMEAYLKMTKSKDPKVWEKYIAGLEKKGYDKSSHKEHPHYKWAVKKLKSLK